MDGFIQLKPIERVRAVQKICAAIRESMDSDDIEIFFSRMRIRVEPYASYYSLDAFIRDYLAKCSDSTLIDIAEQLELTLPAGSTDLSRRLGDSKYWLIDHLRVFISHVHTAKVPAANLRMALQKYGISAFVAHDDIAPTDEWREQILASLMSMDVFVPIITTDFTTSKWTDQEVGAAVARDVLIVPVSKGAMPYGFIEKYQSLKTDGRSVAEVAEAVFRAISTNPRSRERMIDCLVATISSSSSVEEALFRVQKLDGISDVSGEHWERIRENVAANATLVDSEEFVAAINTILDAHGIDALKGGGNRRPPLDDEIPF